MSNILRYQNWIHKSKFQIIRFFGAGTDLNEYNHPNFGPKLVMCFYTQSFSCKAFIINEYKCHLNLFFKSYL